MAFRDPTAEEAELFITALRARNWSLLRRIVQQTYPYVLWGSVMHGLTEKQQVSAQQAFIMPGTFVLTTPPISNTSSLSRSR